MSSFNINTQLWSGGPSAGQFFDFPNIKPNYVSINQQSDPLKRTMYPLTTGTSVIGFVYDGGVMVAADTKGSYGSLARFMNIERVLKVTDKAVLACGGDIADYQFIKDLIEQKVRDDECGGYSAKLDAGALHCWLTRFLYNRRTKIDPLWLECIVAGYKDNKPYLGFVDKIGMAFEAPEVSSGFGVHFALPMIREAREKKPNLSLTDAQTLMRQCMEMLYYRDCKAHYQYQLANITPAGVTIETMDIKSNTNWELAHITSGY